MNPSRTMVATSGPAPVWITAGPHTARSFPPPARARRIRSATSATRSAFGFSDETSEAMNSNGLRPLGRSSGRTRTPSGAADDEVAHAGPGASGRCGPSVLSAETTRPQSISGFSTSSHSPADLHRRGEVGGGVEPGRQHPVHGGGDQFGVGLGDRVGAVGVEAGQQRGQRLLVGGRDLDPGPGQVGGRLADVHLDDLVVGLRLDDLVEDLGQDQRVDDVAGDLDDVGGAHGRGRLLRPCPSPAGLRRRNAAGSR